MKTLTEQLAELQKGNLEPVRQLNDQAFSAFEQIARKNYELMGDMVDYAVAQSRGQLESNTPKERLERQMHEAKAFAERMGERVAEYTQLANAIRTNTTSVASEVIRKAAPEASSSANPASIRSAVDAPTSAATPEKAVTKKVARKKTATKSAAGKAATTKATTKGAPVTASKKKATAKKAASGKRAG